MKFACETLYLIKYKNHIFVEKVMERDNFMSPTEAKEFGIIDKILAHPMQEETSKVAIEKSDNVATKPVTG